MIYKITGTVPTPWHNGVHFYDHAPGHEPITRPRKVGETGRKTTVLTDNRHIAEVLKGVFDKVFINVTMTRVGNREQKGQR